MIYVPNIRSAFQAIRNENITNRAKELASYFLDTYKWTPEQEEYLRRIEKRGYLISPYNDVMRAFGGYVATDGEKKMVMSLMASFNPVIRKKDLSFYAL